MNVTSLKVALSSPAWTPSTAQNYSSLYFLDSFRWALLAYALLPTVLLVINISLLSWKYAWVNDILRELVVLGISFFMIVIRNPFRRSSLELERVSTAIHNNVPLASVLNKDLKLPASSSQIRSTTGSSTNPRRNRGNLRNFRLGIGQRIRSRRTVTGVSNLESSHPSSVTSASQNERQTSSWTSNVMSGISRVTQRPYGGSPVGTGNRLFEQESSQGNQESESGIELANV